MTFQITYAAQSLDEFRALMSEFPALANGAQVVKAPSQLSAIIGDSEERKLRDEWKLAMGKNFSFKKTMRANYASPVEALRAWKSGAMNQADMTAANDDSAPSVPTRDTSADDTDEVLD